MAASCDLRRLRKSIPFMKIAVLVCCLALLLDSPLLEAGQLLQPNDRLAICGDGGIDGPGVYIEDYLLTSEPVAGLNVAQFSWGAGDPAGFLARLTTDVLPFKPTAALLDFNSGDVTTREKVQTDLVEALKKAGVRTIVIGSPACVDSVTYQHDPAKAAAENKQLGALADIDKGVAAKEGVAYADVYGVTMAAMAKAKEMHGDSFEVQGDAGALAIASAFLKALGCSGDIGTLTVDYAAGKAEGTPGQEIVSYQDNTLKVESTRVGFWFPGHGVGGTDTPPWPNLKYLTFNEDLNRYMLIVKNLPTAETKVYWGDSNEDFSSAELARGVNLSAVVPGFGNPFGGVDSNVDNGVRGQQEEERIASTALIQGKPDPQADAKLASAFQVAESRIKPVETTLRFQPLIAPDKQPPGPIPVILDTDLDGDVDDVGALALLNDFMDQGECTLLACVHNTVNGNLSSCATIQAIDAYYGHPSIPIGQYYGEPDAAAHVKSVLTPAPPDGYHGPAVGSGSSYTLPIHQKFDPNFPNDDKMPAGVDVYRKALASAVDGSVVICSVGLMENLQDLIQSQPDSVSDLNGLDLVRKKVRELVIMANTVPPDHYLLSKWPTKIMWTTDVGSGIGTGPSLIPTPENNPVRVAYDLFGVLHTGRQSWDLTAAWLAVREPGDLWDVIAGRPQYINDITHSPSGPYPQESVVTIKMPGDEVSKVIGTELARPPKKTP
jgi:hypothetical protein